MDKTHDLKLNRRDFIGCASGFMLGSCFLNSSSLRLYEEINIQELKEELTPEEQELVENSALAQELKKLFGKGYSCAESFFKVSLGFMKESEKLAWVASGFGGGIYHKDICGYLTSGVMAIGLKGGSLEKERKEKKDHVRSAVKQYWKWWISQAPLHCSEIRKKGTSSKVCRRLGQLAAVRIEELIK